MRAAIEVSAYVEDPAALIGIARKQYERSVTAIDVDGMTDEEALAVADLTPEEKRAHPRYITPEAAISDVPAAVLRIIEGALDEVGVMVEEAATRPLGDVRERRTGELSASRWRGRPRSPHNSRREPRSARRRRWR